MEGCKKGLGTITKSLRFKLIVILTLIGMICSAVSSALSYYNFKADSLEFLDDELKQVAAAAINYDISIPKRWDGPRHRYMYQSYSLHLGHENFRFFKGNKDDPIVIAPLYGRLSDSIFIPSGIEDGLYTLIISDVRARVLVATHYNGKRFVVAKSLTMTMNMAKNAFIVSFVEFLVLSFVYVVSIVISLNLIFKVVTNLSLDVSRIKVDNLSPIAKDSKDTYIPNELHGFIEAINLLLERININMQNQKRFIADAAHEMRTPLTALSLQVESLANEDLNETSKAKVLAIKTAILHEKDLMNSLLTLARTQSSKSNDISTIKVNDLFISLIDKLGALADEKDIDFGIEGEVTSEIVCSLSDVSSIMSNFCSNAIKYTPNGGRVDLMCVEDDKTIRLIVKDNGPGIKEDELKLVLEPFYRCGGDSSKHLGTGLGLAIAKASADRMHATIDIQNSKEGGLIASLIFNKA